ncbi:hypothetical protein COJ90_21025 [Priestia megaterium]|uniref:DUF2971 domain-containing protein n=1 Tax=Priestia megaterium TaxID=1404 RepID=UPI000BF86FCD|nr:DUF2971 domain-containing protein [Priestia megaterium]PFP09389.1 hypothetical protein COJ90_21025 [Priestia megaterium]
METTQRHWKEEIADKIFTIGATDEDLDTALKLKRDNIPQSLYKYRAVSEYSIKNFKNDQIWFNSSSKMNDPYDSSLGIDREIIVQGLLEKENFDECVQQTINDYMKTNPPPEEIEEVKAEIHELAAAGIALLNKKFEECVAPIPSFLQDRTYISCFSEKKDSILMWSHYTNNHEGFCLEYDFTEYAKTSANFLEALNPVIYDNKIFDLSHHTLDITLKRTKLDSRVVRNFPLLKSQAWSYEEEWRLILFDEPRDTGFEKGTFKPKAIYLGAKIDEKDKASLIELAKEKNVDVYQMKLKNTEFKLEAHPEYIVSRETVK